MSIFLTVMIVGLVGLLVMALPGMGRHGHAGHALRGPGGHTPLLPHLSHSGSGGHAAALPHAAGGHSLAAPHASAGGVVRAGSNPGSPSDPTFTGLAAINADPQQLTMLRLLPSPRAVFSVLAVFGVSGYVLTETLRLPMLLAALIALVPAVVIERLVLTPFWNFLFRFQGEPSRPLEELLLCEAVAVTPFRNVRGIVKVNREGRIIQLSAGLIERQAGLAVSVGDKLMIEDVDAPHERVTVSIQ